VMLEDIVAAVDRTIAQIALRTEIPAIYMVDQAEVLELPRGVVMLTQEFIQAVPKYQAIRLTGDNWQAVADWCHMQSPPGKSTLYQQPAEIGDWVVRPKEWEPERMGGFTYEDDEFRQRFDPREPT
jgi:hypothetical protein